MRALVVAVVSVALTVSGCASNWNYRGAPSEKIAQDRYRCTQESRTGFSGGGTGYYGLGAILASGIAAQAGAQRLFDLCMEAAGYSKINADIAQAPIVQPVAAAPYPQAGQPPSGEVRPELYRAPIAGAAPVPVSYGGDPVETEIAVRGDQARTRSAPKVALSIKAESTYMLTAEALAKANGCTPPAAAMTAKGAGQESFMVACPDGTTIALQCGVEGCRILR